MIEEAVMNYPGGTRRHLRGTSEAPRGTQEAPHPGGTPEAPRRHPEAPRGSPGGQTCLGGKMSQNICVLSKKVSRPAILPARGDLTLTKYRACAQYLAAAEVEASPRTHHQHLRKSARAPSV